MRVISISIIGCAIFLMSSAGWSAPVKKGAHKSDTAAGTVAPKIEAGSQMLLVFPSFPKQVPFSEKELSLFRGSLSETDRLGIMVADRKEHLLTLDAKQQKEVTSASIVSAFEAAVPESGSVVDTEEDEIGSVGVSVESALRSAVAQVSDLDGMVKAVVLVLDKPLPFSTANVDNNGVLKDTGTDTDTGTASDADGRSLLSLLTLNNIILYALYSTDVEAPLVEQLAEQSGGKNFFLSQRTTLNDSLYFLYDSILLRTIQLAPQQALYDSDEVCPEVPTSLAAASSGAGEGGPQWPVYVLLAILILLGSALLVLITMMWQRIGKPAPVAKETSDIKEEKQASSFSKLTIGLNRVRNSFAETESKLHALSADLDDFGIENWELQKKIVSAYAEMARELFLLYDHVLLKPNDELSDGEQLLKRKIEQLLEAADVAEMTPEVGSRFHSKYHRHAGERYSEQKAGTILEVVRKGYQRKGFVSDEPFVIRQAEVIVSAGLKQGAKE
ncbi:MAG: nucleotide exchange factor GrpE [Deltaproteobacteria bacterium]|nr:nucleotide exchange factor GrpE [Deltaproteobacteria bacterium]MBN2674257.1 nucleotide exchange factor GrpE [Deltaproteobacteria bacterium]